MLLDINFNFSYGDYYGDSDNTFAIKLAVASIIITAIVTIVCQRLYDNFKANEHLDALFRYVKGETDRISENGMKQVAAISKLNKVLKSNIVGDYDVTKISAFDMELVSEWKTSEFYFSIITRRKESEDVLLPLYAKVKESIKHSQELQLAVQKGFEDMSEREMRIQQRWQQRIQTIRNFPTGARMQRKPLAKRSCANHQTTTFKTRYP